MINSAATPRYGAINVPLSILWEKTGAQQKNFSIAAANDPAMWSAQLSDNQRYWLVGRANTMALYGERVAILNQKGDWLFVAAVSQCTYLNSYGYPGWVLASQVTINSTYLNDQTYNTQAVIMNPKAILYSDSSLTNTQQNRELSYQVSLPILSETTEAFEVRLPNGSIGYLSRLESIKITELTYSGTLIVAEARKFIGLKYLWAGTSSYGFDCSGFTLRVYQSVGISIPRDSNEQAQEGIPISKEELLPGDLLFFATDNGQGKIHHVGIYSGTKDETGELIMIHSPHTGLSITEEEIRGTYLNEYWGARRYVQNLLSK
ncbi:C40 family peptidase [Bacillus sp. UNC41MFS5]|uniref:C40 family peptidase n=1 Tax=Bacillus sp. UNC41MFS5 TaxID=1449046 RepID=UPI00047B55B8|nr:C40 family peptidase [Bacillus sp. UNC41MFS5]